MALNFPNNPQLYEKYIVNNTIYQWQGSDWAIVQAAYTTLHEEKSAIQHEEVFDLSSKRSFSVDLIKNTSTDIKLTNPPSDVSKTTITLKRSNIGNINIGTTEPDGNIFDFGALIVDPVSVKFNTDGTKFYVLGANNQRIYQFGVDTPWDLSTYYYERKSYSTNNEASLETSPGGLFIKPDGTKFYIIGTNADTVRQYSMRTPWDISTGIYDNSFYSIAQDPQPYDLYFSNDGKQMYVLGVANSRIFQYQLTTPWLVNNTGNISYTNKNILVSTQEATPRAFTFNNDGTILYMTGLTNSRIYQYPISVAWDLFYATYDNKFSISFASVETTIIGIVFGNNGNLLYITGTSNDSLTSFVLSTPYDLNSGTASPTSTTTIKYSLPFTAQGTSSTRSCFRISPDGKKAYMLDNNADRIYQYTLRTPWDINTMNYDNINFSVVAQDAVAYSMHFKPDGTTFYILGNNSTVYMYTMSTPWDLKTAGYTGDFKTLPTSYRGLSFNLTGTRMYVLRQAATSFIEEYTLTTPWEPRTATLARALQSPDGTPRDFYISDNGKNIFVIGSSNSATDDSIWQYSLSIPDTLTSPLLIVSKPLTGFNDPQSVYFSSDLSKMYITSLDGVIHQFFNKDGAWRSTSLVDNNAPFTMTGQDNDMRGIFITNDGTKMFAAGISTDIVFRYTLATPWDTSTAFVSAEDAISIKYIGNIIPQAAAIELSPDGLNLMILSASDDTIYRYNMTTPWDLSTANYVAGELFVITQDTVPYDMHFSPDGNTLYVLGTTNDRIYQYILPAAWDIKSSNMAYTGISRLLTSATANPEKFVISPDGKNMIIWHSNGTIAFWFFVVPWDASSLMYISQSTTPGILADGMAVRPDGAILYILRNTNIIQQYTIFDVSPSVIWPNNIVWQANTAPYLPDINQSIQIDLYSTDGGLTYFGHTKMSRLFSPDDLY